MAPQPHASAAPLPASPRAIAVSRALSQVLQEDRGRLLAILAAGLRDISLAEEALQEAAISALSHWGRAGLPASPRGWLLQVARRKAIDRLRAGARERARDEAIARLQGDEAAEAAVGPGEIPDKRLALIFACCHPALEEKTQIALTLRVVCGLPLSEIAQSFLDAEPTMGQRLSRAKAKIAKAGIPFAVPQDDQLSARLGSVLRVIYLILTSGYRQGQAEGAHDLCQEALYLARLVNRLLPAQAEAEGCLALILVTLARAPARFDAAGAAVALADQDRSLWDGTLLAEGRGHLHGALSRRKPGPFQIKAAIADCHCAEGGSDWPQIRALGQALLQHEPSPVNALSLAVATMECGALQEAGEILAQIASGLTGYQPFFAVRAEWHRRADLPAAARLDYLRAIGLAQSGQERDFLSARLADLPPAAARG